MPDLPTVHTLWIGSSLGPLARACLKSFLAVGHPVILHVYENMPDVPAGIELRDASETLSRDRLFRHRKGSISPFADVFRYRLLRNGAELYADCDVYCLRPIPRADYIFGLQDDSIINNAVLALPADSSLLATLISITEQPHFVPPWLPRSKRWRLALSSRARIRRLPAALPWGSLGPNALTHYAKRLGVHHLALPVDVFYPVSPGCSSLLCDPELSIEDLVTPRTRCIHLWNEVLRRRMPHIPRSSPLGRILALRADVQLNAA
ncbi:galactosyltransferase Lgt5 [Rhodoligotrophos defluvii]|uniref:galactosyltransferase Lgt5 n=1 Tax=Rhodoligotrophos defluvii TaxID=2561934 RepID=UPI0010C95F47|nr:galactosyltransferase Lgt5 [Rhodoligotrophos defluvii]